MEIVYFIEFYLGQDRFGFCCPGPEREPKKAEDGQRSWTSAVWTLGLLSQRGGSEYQKAGEGTGLPSADTKYDPPSRTLCFFSAGSWV